MSIPPGVFLALREPEDARFYPSVIPVQSYAPPVSARVWLDTSTEPATFKSYNGTAWAAIGTQGPQGIPGAAIAALASGSTVLADRAIGTDGTTVALGNGSSTFTNLPESRKFVTIAGLNVAGDARWQRDLGVITPQMYGAVGDGITDDTTAIQDALDAAATFGARRVMVPAGTYSTNEVRIPTNVTLCGAGRGATVLLARNSAFAMVSSGVTLPSVRAATLTANAAPGARTLTVDTTAAFAPGDWVLLADNSVPDSAYATRKAGELLQVVSVVSSTSLKVAIDDPAGSVTPDGIRGAYSSTGWGSYTTANDARLFLIPMRENIGVESLTLRNPNPDTGSVFGLGLTGTVGARVRDVEIEGMDGSGINVNTSWGATVEGCWFHDLTDDEANSRYGYGVNLSGASHHVVVTACLFERVRHAVTTNGTDLGGIPSHVTVSDCRAYRTTGASFDTHGAGAYIRFADCVSVDAVAWGYQSRGRHVTFDACVAIRPGLDGFNVTTSGTTGRGCRIQSGRVHAPKRFGIKVGSSNVADVEIADTLIELAGDSGIRVERGGTNGVRIIRPRIYNAARSVAAAGISTAGASGSLTGLVVVGGTFAQTEAGSYTVAIRLGAATDTGAIVQDNRGWGLTGTFFEDLGTSTVKANNSVYA